MFGLCVMKIFNVAYSHIDKLTSGIMLYTQAYLSIATTITTVQGIKYHDIIWFLNVAQQKADNSYAILRVYGENGELYQLKLQYKMCNENGCISDNHQPVHAYDVQ